MKLETKPAFYTTEFWVMILSNLGGAVDLTGIWNYAHSNQWIVLALAIVNALYMKSRGDAKSGVPYTGPKTGLGDS